MRRVLVGALLLGVCFGIASRAQAQCKNLAKAAKDIAFTKEVKADKNAVYLCLIGGETPKPNACGLKPKNDSAQWTGWGGPLDTDNASIGEGVGTRNFITIGGVRYERGIGAHAAATYVYDLTGGSYKMLAGVVGMDDEKDGPVAGGKYNAPECGHGGSSEYIFSIDGKELWKSGVQKGIDGGNQVAPKEFSLDIPAGAKELKIAVSDGGDGASCDHSDIGDPKLVAAAVGTAVEPAGKAALTWGTLKLQ